MTDIYLRFTNYISKIIDNDSREWNFKRNEDFIYMLEHVMPDMGEEYLEKIQEHKKYENHKELLIKLCRINDIYGQPRRYDFKEFLYTSCTNLRYIFFALRILDHIEETYDSLSILPGIDIVEIGCGYGGLCFFLYNIAPIYGISIKSYSCFDLQEPLMLQEKYLELVRIGKKQNIKFCHLESDDWKIENNSFMISTFAFSEINQEIRDKYVEKVLKYVDHGFIAWNNIPFYNFIDAEFRIEKEEPETTWEFNRFIYF